VTLSGGVLSELPAALAIVGGGSIGCELGQAFARLGSRVSVVEGAPSILPCEDPRAAAELARALVADGVDLYVDHRGFVVVDDLLRTTNPHMWAAGDLTGHPQFTHTAGVHASLAASNAILGLRRKVDRTAVPRVTFTDPEVAAVGLETGRVRTGLHVVDWSHAHVDRAVAEGAIGGFARLVVDKRGHVLGATVVGPRAGETLGELTLAITRGLTTRNLAGVTHAYPTYNDGPWNAAISDVQTQLERPNTRRALRAMARLRRWWVSREPDQIDRCERRRRRLHVPEPSGEVPCTLEVSPVREASSEGERAAILLLPPDRLGTGGQRW